MARCSIKKRGRKTSLRLYVVEEQYCDPKLRNRPTHELIQPYLFVLDISRNGIECIKMTESTNKQTIGIDMELCKFTPNVEQMGLISLSEMDNNNVENPNKSAIEELQYLDGNEELNDANICLHWKLYNKCEENERGECLAAHPQV